MGLINQRNHKQNESRSHQGFCFQLFVMRTLARVILSGATISQQAVKCCEVEPDQRRAREARDLRANHVPLVDPQNAYRVLTFKNQQFVADF